MGFGVKKSDGRATFGSYFFWVFCVVCISFFFLNSILGCGAGIPAFIANCAPWASSLRYSHEKTSPPTRPMLAASRLSGFLGLKLRHRPDRI